MIELTRKQSEVLDLLEAGFHNREIGNVLGISSNTVAKHLTVIYRKLSVTNRGRAMARNTTRRCYSLNSPKGHFVKESA